MKHYLENIVLIYVLIALMDFVIQTEHVKTKKKIVLIILIQEMIVQYYVLIYHQIVEPAIEIILVLRVLMKHYLENIVLIHVIIVLMGFAIKMEHV